MSLRFIISQLPLRFGADCDSAVTLPVNRGLAEENNYCDVPGPGEQLPETTSSIALERGIGS